MDTYEWTWVSGTFALNRVPHYGEKGVPHPLNEPGGRAGSCLWEGFDGYLYMFGGLAGDFMMNGLQKLNDFNLL